MRDDHDDTGARPPADAPVDRARDRRRWWVWPLLVALVWIAVGGAFGSYAGKLSEVQTNDNASFLPESADSTAVLEWQARFQGSESLPAVVAYRLPEGTPAKQELPQVQADLQQMQSIDGVTGVQPPTVSPDGRAIQAVVNVDADIGNRISELVDSMRAVLDGSQVPGDTYVTGPAGVLGDLLEAFGAIDGLLLVVALCVVLVILLIVYRSPVLPIVVLLTALLALAASSAVIYAMADADVLRLDGMGQGILFVLIIGASTDYALLLVSRYREELREHQGRMRAMRAAYRGVWEPIVASGSTVILGLLCMLLSDLKSNQSLGPVGAIGIAAAMLASLTFLPAVLVLFGRAAYWPFRPVLGSPHAHQHGIWGRVAALVGRRPRVIWVTVVVVLLGFATLVPTFKDEGTPQSEVFLANVDSKQGQRMLNQHFPQDLGSPVVVVGPQDDLRSVLQTIDGLDGFGDVFALPADPRRPDAGPKVVDGQVMVLANLTHQADSEAGEQSVRELRDQLTELGPDVLVGGQTATLVDTLDTSAHDRNRIMPAILIVVFLVLVLLLRALVAPLLLVVANVLSFGATIGISALVFNHLFDFPGADPSIPLFGFVFLVALGVDYSIFLMTRAREEAAREGTRPGMLTALAATGGVITSAGIVLAATFTALGVLPLLFLAQIAFIVGFGVLLDTFVVRSLLVPSASYDIGPAVWWPSRLARGGPKHRAAPGDDTSPVSEPAGDGVEAAAAEGPDAGSPGHHRS